MSHLHKGRLASLDNETQAHKEMLTGVTCPKADGTVAAVVVKVKKQRATRKAAKK